ncbi:NgoMIV family type II restriction endonuclease [Catellatospora paridis]|uniref:NgoMIV family type II restriction endonuclease n=1 Tax=Catellatospora paridis TaxID=1617086 RepID=UPI0012D412C1|nr:NgoMIV family type II restriction endonuclease [Catellatospora paridis]
MTTTDVTAPAWLIPLLGYRKATQKQTQVCTQLFGEAHAPNIADASSATSTRIAGVAYKILGISQTGVADLSKADEPDDDDAEETTRPKRKKSTGVTLEHLIRDDLAEALVKAAPDRDWKAVCGRRASSYQQFSHLDALHRLFTDNPALRSTVGQDYQVQTDVCIGLPHHDGSADLLHAAVSSKWSLRSDRAQNVRHEFATLVRNRRGRLPHLVLVTAEPLPTRLLSIARGTGDIDAVYHLLFDEIAKGVETSTRQQKSAWAELVGQGRLLPYRALAPTLAHS